jgi:hypothetical protein
MAQPVFEDEHPLDEYLKGSYFLTPMFIPLASHTQATTLGAGESPGTVESTMYWISHNPIVQRAIEVCGKLQ